MSRKKVETYVLSIMKQLTNNNRNYEIYKEKFEEMSDKDFKLWVESVIKGETKLAVYLQNDGTSADMEACFAFAEDLNYRFTQKLVIPRSEFAPEHVTPVEHFVGLCPVRRQSQTFSKKVSVPKHDQKIDALTGQPLKNSGSDSSTMSAPENRLLVGIGLKYTAREYNKIRGGDVGAYRAYKYFLENGGEVSQQEIEEYATGVGSVKVMRSWLRAKHIDSTL